MWGSRIQWKWSQSKILQTVHKIGFGDPIIAYQEINDNLIISEKLFKGSLSLTANILILNCKIQLLSWNAEH